MATCLNGDANAGCSSSAGGGGGGGGGVSGGGGGSSNKPLLWKSNGGGSGGDGGDGAGDTGLSGSHTTTGIPWRESAPPSLPWRGGDDPVPPLVGVAGIAPSVGRGGGVGGGGGNGSGMEVMEASKVRPMNNGMSIPAATSPAGVPFEAGVMGCSRGMVSVCVCFCTHALICN